MRLEGKVAVIVGAGQSPGEGIGNGRATTLRFAQEGARILAVDRLIASAEETAAMATQGGECVPFAADVTKEETLAAAMEAARARWGRIDILHNNVGVSIGGGDKPLDELSEEAFDRVCAINLRGTIMACKHVLPIMRLQRSGTIINISSVAARENSYPLVTYKATKAAMIAFTEQLALQNAPYGIRANCILPGLMDTPMAVDTRARARCGAVVAPRTAGIGAKALLDWQAGMVGPPRWLPPFGPRNSPSATKTGCFVPGTDGSNPSPSSGESASPMLTAIYHMLKNATKYHDLCSCAEASPRAAQGSTRH